jgi:hypothetical protein
MIRGGIAGAIVAQFITVILIIVGAAILTKLNLIGMAVLEWFQ